MAKFGSVGFVDLDRRVDGLIKSYMGQVESGLREDGHMARLRHLARANYAHCYIHYLRRRSNEFGYVTRASRLERQVLQPWHAKPQQTERADKFAKSDYYVERQAIAHEHVTGLRDALFDQPAYYDPYRVGFEHTGRPEETNHPLLYMESQALFTNPHFLNICANPEIIGFCKEVLGGGAALSWAWSWITNPILGLNYQNQNWHRDSSEPLNFIRIFVPLQSVVDLDDGPTALIPGSSHVDSFREVRRFSDEDLAPLTAELGAGMIQADAGDVYFMNTMAIHRGVQPLRRRGILSLLVSLSPSHRTPAMIPLAFRDLPDAVKDTVAANRHFFRYLVK